MKNKIEEQEKHHTYGGSTSKRFLNCTASTKAIIKDREDGKIPMHQISSEAANEGTAAHKLGEVCIEKGYEVNDFYMQEFEGYTMDESFIEAVEVYVNHVRKIANSKKGTIVFVEESYDLSGYMGADAGGSADCTILVPIRGNIYDMHTIDYKHGKGIVVEIEGNTQAPFYSFGALRKHKDIKIRNVHQTIVQPRVNHIDGPVRTIVEKARDIKKWGRSVLKKGIRISESGKGEFKAGEWCTFCPRSGYCKELKEYNTQLVKADFDDDYLKPIDPSSLTADEIEKILLNIKVLKNWIKDVESYALTAAENGHQYENFKTVNRVGHRKFALTEKRILRKLKKKFKIQPDEVYTKSMLSPSKMEQLIIAETGDKKAAKEFVDGISYKPEIGKSLAPLTDGREAAKSSAKSDFSEV